MCWYPGIFLMKPVYLFFCLCFLFKMLTWEKITLFILARQWSHCFTSNSISGLLFFLHSLHFFLSFFFKFMLLRTFTFSSLFLWSIVSCSDIPLNVAAHISVENPDFDGKIHSKRIEVDIGTLKKGEKVLWWLFFSFS